MSEENNTHAQSEDQEIKLYEKLVLRSKDFFDSAREKTAEAYNKSVEAAKEELIQTGQFSRAQGEKLKKYLQRDLSNTGAGIKNLRESLQVERLGSGIQNAFAAILGTLGSAFSEWSSRIEASLTYKTGELSSPGALICKNCAGKMHFKKTGKIPPCPKCSGTEFKK